MPGGYYDGRLGQPDVDANLLRCLSRLPNLGLRLQVIKSDSISRTFFVLKMMLRAECSCKLGEVVGPGRLKPRHFVFHLNSFKFLFP